MISWDNATEHYVTISQHASYIRNQGLGVRELVYVSRGEPSLIIFIIE